MKYSLSYNKPINPGYYWHKYDFNVEPGNLFEIVEVYFRLDGQPRVKFLERYGAHDKLLNDEMFNGDMWSQQIEEPEPPQKIERTTTMPSPRVSFVGESNEK